MDVAAAAACDSVEGKAALTGPSLETGKLVAWALALAAALTTPMLERGSLLRRGNWWCWAPIVIGVTAA